MTTSRIRALVLTQPVCATAGSWNGSDTEEKRLRLYRRLERLLRTGEGVRGRAVSPCKRRLERTGCYTQRGPSAPHAGKTGVEPA